MKVGIGSNRSCVRHPAASCRRPCRATSPIVMPCPSARPHVRTTYACALVNSKQCDTLYSRHEADDGIGSACPYLLLKLVWVYGYSVMPSPPCSPRESLGP
jgi:hypothetical protein